jgi:SpoVK/Ycf46/Vps4 family AAA+-type ATPase
MEQTGQQQQSSRQEAAKPQAFFICPSCSRENRPAAKFCRFCGKSMPEAVEQPSTAAGQGAPESASATQAPPPPSDYIGLGGIRAELEQIQKSIDFQRKKAEKGGIVIEAKAGIFVFRGNTGTGKTLVAASFVKDLKKAKCLESDIITTISARALSRQHKDEFALANFLTETKPAALVVDNAAEDEPFLHELLLALGKARQNCIAILLGLGDPFDEFFKNYPEDKQRVSRFFEFPDPSTEELSLILEKKLREKGYVFAPSMNDVFITYIKERRHDPRCEHKNGWLVENDIIPAIEKNQEERLRQQDSLSAEDYKTILEIDAPLKNKKRTVDEILAELDSMIGLGEVKKAVRAIAQAIVMQKEREAKGLKGQGQAIHIVFTGNPGTGKTTVARRLGQLFQTIGLLSSDKIVETDRAGMVGQYVGTTAPLVNEACDKALGGILFIDEAYTLSGGKEGNADSFGQEAIDTLLKRMEDDRGKFVVIAAGYKDEMDRFIQSNPGLKSRFTHFLHLEDYSPEELYAIFESMAKQNGYELAAGAKEIAREAIEDIHRSRGRDFANGRTMRNLFDDAIRRMGSRLAALPAGERTEEALALIEAQDIPYEKKKILTVEEILAELDAMTGLANVKQEVRKLANAIRLQQERREQGLGDQGQAIHIVFTGNPGTGKTTVARKLGALFKAMELLPRPDVIEKDKSGMVGQYVGQTPKLVNQVCDDAMGAILFVDEAYTLAGESGAIDSFGKEAIETLMKRMEDDRGKFVVIAAGYKKEMERFLNANPGMKSRFTHYIHLEDYNPGELFAIFDSMLAKQQYVLAEDGRAAVKEAIEDIYQNRGNDFANGRTMRNLCDEVVRRLGDRVASLPREERTKDVLTTITAADIPYEKKKIPTVEEILSDLEGMIGLAELKQAVRTLAQAIMIEKEKEEQGLQSQGQAIHIVFTGNPGTGKTTVARKLGALFHVMGLLPSAKVVEVDRSKLVASYVGQTAPQVNRVCDDAMGGILFIDEAYTLKGDGGNDFGQEAIDALLKRMEDDRGKFVVIAAGYERNMQAFIQSNPGLQSRFTHFLHLEDYNSDELFAIYESMAKQNGYALTGEAQTLARKAISEIYRNRGQDFANGRTMRNLLDETKRRLASRIALLAKESRTKETLTLITAEDIPFTEAP